MRASPILLRDHGASLACGQADAQFVRSSFWFDIPCMLPVSLEGILTKWQAADRCCTQAAAGKNARTDILVREEVSPSYGIPFSRNFHGSHVSFTAAAKITLSGITGKMVSISTPCWFAADHQFPHIVLANVTSFSPISRGSVVGFPPIERSVNVVVA